MTLRSPRWIVSLLVLAVVGATFVADRGGRAVAAGPEAIASGPDLRWGFKQSWRGYVGLPQVSGGATIDSTLSLYNVGWEFSSGSYDPETRTTRLGYTGSVRWQGHRASADGLSPPPGYSGEPDPYILDVTLSDPEITIGRDESVLTAIARSRDRDTWQLVEYGRMPVVGLDAFGVTPTVAAGTTEWAGIPAVVTEQGRDVFGGVYMQNQVVDPVGFSYAGSGGAPDFSEHWDPPGAPRLKLLQNVVFHEDPSQPELLPAYWVDRKNLVVHWGRTVKIGATNFTRLGAFDLEKMATVAQIDIPRTQLGSPLHVVGYDTNRNRMLTRSGTETGMPRWIEFDPVAERYEAGAFTDPQVKQNSFINPSVSQKLAWDPTRNRGYRVQRVVPDGVDGSDYDNHEWKLFTYREGSDGIWVKQSLALPGFPAGQNEKGYAQGYAVDAPTYATASDGSLIVLATARSGLAATATIPGAYRLTIDDATEAVTVQPLPGAEVENDVGSTFAAVQTAPGGHVVLVDGNGSFVHLRIGSGGQVDADPPVSIVDNFEPGFAREWRFAIDPDDGLVWYGGSSTLKIAAFQGGGFLGDQMLPLHSSRGGPVVVGEDGIVYAQTSDGSPAQTGGSSTWGFGKYEQLGFVPEVTVQPQPAAATLGVGEESETVAFASGASADPAAARQWQVKPPGSSRFVDIEGETGPTLAVAAARGDDGAEYRAVYENAAGRVASDAAALAVDYAPLLLAELGNVSVTEGSAAEFSLLPDGNPMPTVVWQRRVSGFWQDVAPDDENFEIEGASLTVLETNAEQSGALFRARLTNSLGSVTSRVARLTVAPKASIPPQGIDLDAVSLDWTGSAELQKARPFGGSSYFSAGPSNGDEASYRAVAGDAAIYQVGAGGDEALATWATRASHVGSGGTQLARLHGGEGRIEPDGSVEVAWDGAFSVNFYGGLVPFTLSELVLEIDDEGEGTLSATLSGFASSMADPSQRTPLAPVQDVTVASFSGVDVDPSADLTISPDYAGVEVAAPAGSPPQERTAVGWGAWPQPFVDFHGKTGLASYWYSSGGIFDPHKPPSPFAVDFEGGAAPGAPVELDPPVGGGASEPPAPPRPQVSVRRSARVKRGKATLMRLACPGPSACALRLPEWVTVKIAGRTYWAKTIAPEWVDPGETASVKLRLSRAARLALGDGAVARVRLRVAVDSGAGTEKQLIRVRLEP